MKHGKFLLVGLVLALSSLGVFGQAMSVTSSVSAAQQASTAPGTNPVAGKVLRPPTRAGAVNVTDTGAGGANRSPSAAPGQPRGHAPATASTVVVTPANMQGWAFVNEGATGSGALVSGPASPPLGGGSVGLTIDSTGREDLDRQSYAGTPLNQLTALTYSTYGPNNTQAATLQLDVNYDGVNHWEGRLVYEPYMNGSVIANTWQAWNATSPSAVWWATGSPGNTHCPQATPCTLAQVLGYWPNATISTVAQGGELLLKAGGPWSASTYYADALTVGVNGNSTTYDFENPQTLIVGTCPGAGYTSIQAAVDASHTNDTIQICPGTFRENVTINKSVTLVGAGSSGANATIVEPALSHPDCAGGSLCPGGSNIFLVQASNVTVHDLKLEGDNPTISSGITRGGVDIDARNALITDHRLGITFDNLVVYNTVVQDIFLRGMYASTGGTFDFHNNSVQNVQGDGGSIGIFNFAGSGNMANNTVADTNDALSANHSRGTQFLTNTITNSHSGVHTDNAGDGGGVADVLQGNIVSVTNAITDAYGVWDFVPYIAPTISNNTATNCAVGLAAAGQGVALTTVFTQNTVDGAHLAGSAGVYVTTSEFGFGDSNVSASFSNNFIRNNDTSFYIELTGSGPVATVVAHNNSITGNAAALTNLTGAVQDFSANWWGTNTAAGVAGAAGSNVDYTPWLDNGTDTAPGTPGFQGDFSALDVSAASPQTGTTGKIQEGVNLVTVGGTVNVLAGTYPEQVAITKALTLNGAGSSNTIIQPTSVTANTTSLTSGNPIAALLLMDGASSVTAQGLRIDGSAAAFSACTPGYVGVYYRNSSGTLQNSDVRNILLQPAAYGCQTQLGVYVQSGNSGSATVNILNNAITNYGKNGITVNEIASQATVTGNTVTGRGPVQAGDAAQNGIQFGFGSSGSIANNTVSNHSYPPDPANASATGILIYQAHVNTSGNTLTENQTGIYEYDTTAPDSHTANTISATHAGTNSTAFWGIIVDASPPSHHPNPYNEPLQGKGKATGPATTQAVALTNNTLTSDSSSGGIGVESDAGYSDQNIDLTATGNFINHWSTGVLLTKCSVSCGTGTFTNVTFFSNDLSNNGPAFANTTMFLANASANWWGSNAQGGVAPLAGPHVDYTPWLHTGTDISGAPGFQGDFSTLDVSASSPQTGAAGRVQEGVTLVTAGGTVNVLPGTYPEQVAITGKSVTVLGPVLGPAPNISTGPNSNAFTIDAAGFSVSLQYLAIRQAASGPAATAVQVTHGTVSMHYLNILTPVGLKNNTAGNPSVAATCNYWNSPSGPNPPGTGAQIQGPATFVPFLRSYSRSEINGCGH